LVIQDAMTPGLIAERVFPLLRKPAFRELGTRITWITGQQSVPATIKIEAQSGAAARLSIQGRVIEIAPVFPSLDLRERNLRALTEKFFIEARRAIQAPAV
jgi:hypothetical protein